MKERAEEVLVQAASEFINRESNRNSMITVTNVETRNRSKHVTVFVSVFPEKETRAACDFLNRKRNEFREYLKKHTRFHPLPIVTFLPSPVVGGVIEPPENI